MLLETCRYKFVDGKLVTKMFGMRGGDWDIEPGWYHDKQEAMAAASKVEDSTDETDETDSTDETVKASRFARTLADELNVDIAKVIGTGKNGVISKDDVIKHFNTLEG